MAVAAVAAPHLAQTPRFAPLSKMPKALGLLDTGAGASAAKVRSKEALGAKSQREPHREPSLPLPSSPTVARANLSVKKEKAPGGGRLPRA